MPTTSLFTPSGGLKYTGKRTFVATTQNFAANPFQNLLSCYIATDVQSMSFFLKINGVVIAHFINDNIVSWELNSNTITIKTKDEIFYVFTFVTVSEAILADQRINDNMNGIITFECGVTSSDGDFNSDFSNDFFN